MYYIYHLCKEFPQGKKWSKDEVGGLSEAIQAKNTEKMARMLNIGFNSFN